MTSQILDRLWCYWFCTYMSTQSKSGGDFLRDTTRGMVTSELRKLRHTHPVSVSLLHRCPEAATKGVGWNCLRLSAIWSTQSLHVYALSRLLFYTGVTVRTRNMSFNETSVTPEVPGAPRGLLCFHLLTWSLYSDGDFLSGIQLVTVGKLTKTEKCKLRGQAPAAQAFCSWSSS